MISSFLQRDHAMNEYFEKVIDYLLEKTIIEKKGLRCNSFDAFSIEKYPQRLYKFRSCTKNGFESLSQEYLWFSTPKKFDDPEDAKIVLGLDENETVAAQNEEKLTSTIVHAWTEMLGPAFEKLGISRESLIEQLKTAAHNEMSLQEVQIEIQNGISTLPQEQQKDAQNLLNSVIMPKMQKLEAQTENARASIINNYRTNQKVCCLTETFNNKKMWEDYSDKYSGFVIEYDIGRIAQSDIEPNDLMLNLFPVDYLDMKSNIDFSPILCELMAGGTGADEDSSKEALKRSFAQSLVKDKIYSSEKEWRFILSKDIDNKLHFPYISAVYAGYRIKPHNFSRLKNKCREKGVSLYKQVYSNQTATLSYEEVAL